MRLVNRIARFHRPPGPKGPTGTDRIGIVGFHSRAFVIAKPAEPFAAWLLERSQRLHEKVNGGTNIAAGIRLGTQLLRYAMPGALRRMWVLSDGEPTEGAADIPQAVRDAHANWININTIGFGDRFDEPLLRSISAATHNGKFVPVKSLRELTQALVGVPVPRHAGRHRLEVTVLVIDVSPSMNEPMEGRRKIDVVEESVLHLLRFKQTCFS